jgi:hypothetical protein
VETPVSVVKAVSELAVAALVSELAASEVSDTMASPVDVTVSTSVEAAASSVAVVSVLRTPELEDSLLTALPVDSVLPDTVLDASAFPVALLDSIKRVLLASVPTVPDDAPTSVAAPEDWLFTAELETALPEPSLEVSAACDRIPALVKPEDKEMLNE